jgi:Uma2 family endonuclease
MAPPGTKRKATYEDLLKVPDTMVAEIVDGELYTWPRPAPRHSVATSVLASDLNAAFQRGRGGPGGWWIPFEPELHLGEDILVPDIAGWRRQHLPEMPDTAFFTTPPDCVCEVLSPWTEKLDRTGKLNAYGRERVRHVWLVNPLARTVEVLRGQGGQWVPAAVHAADETIQAEPFAELAVELRDLWVDPPR